jgi:hypothetical protein
LLGFGVQSRAENDGSWYPVSIETRMPPFHDLGPFTRVDYVPREGASRNWRLCASLPAASVSYFRAVAMGSPPRPRGKA